MKKLSQIVDVVENNFNCVVLKVQEDKFMDLISLGCFDGDETMFRMTKTKYNEPTYTIWRKDGKYFSWTNRTLVTDKVDLCAKKIKYAIENDFNINMRGGWK